MTSDPVRVLVLYSHPLMGEGLGTMLAAEPGIEVHAVDITVSGAVDEALARDPAVIVVEEGGAVDAADIVRRSSCPVVLDVDITTTRAWTLRRESLDSRPDEFLAAIRAAVNGSARTEPIGPARTEPNGPARTEPDNRPVTDRPFTPVVAPG